MHEMTKTDLGPVDRLPTVEESGKIVERKQYATMIEVNGARIYHEVRGSGPSVLFIAGATGDGGHFERVAELLSDEFTVVTYDRRGNSRSPRPDGWESTSTEEQSDDAAGLIEALGLGMQRGGPQGGMEAFLRFFVGEEAFENLDPGLRERMLGNGETFFGLDFAGIGSYQPDDATLTGVEVPVTVVAGAESPPFLIEVSRWLAARLNVELETLPGAHTPYFDRPEEMARALRPLLRKLSG
jgi:pimeloyl-ACP methyl ester carboxylesterase